MPNLNFIFWVKMNCLYHNFELDLRDETSTSKINNLDLGSDLPTGSKVNCFECDIILVVGITLNLDLLG